MRRGIFQPLVLHDDRFFDPDPSIRSAARALYDETRDLPLVCPHGHVEPGLLADNGAFPEPTALLITPDHYIFRLLYARGVPMESLGLATKDGTPFERDPRKIWQLFADHYHVFRGTPTGAWFDHELHDLFGIRVKLDSGSAEFVYEQIAERLQSAEFRPRALFDRFNIEVLATTDKATSDLAAHRRIRESSWSGRVIPTFRPDGVFRVASPAWHDDIAQLAAVAGRSITDLSSFVSVLEERRGYFASLGATATDHAVLDPRTERLQPADAEDLFRASEDFLEWFFPPR